MTDTRTLLANRYRLRERIAVGGVVEVWSASDLTLGRTVAVRLLRAGGDVHVQRFLSAATRVARVRHPGIVRVYDYGAEDLFHVTELVNTSSLAAVMGAGPLDPAWVLDLIRQVAAALEAAHSVDLVHQDIRPWNLLLAPGGTVQLADFGLSGAVVFPEPTPATDLYSLGVVAWECLTGALPSTARPPSLPPLPTVVPDGVADLVTELTAEDPRARPGSAAEIAHRSRELLAVPMRNPAASRLASRLGECGSDHTLLGRLPHSPESASGWRGPVLVAVRSRLSD